MREGSRVLCYVVVGICESFEKKLFRYENFSLYASLELSPSSSSAVQRYSLEVARVDVLISSSVAQNSNIAKQ